MLTRKQASANGAEHRRLRQLLSPAFSDKALQAQKQFIQGYVDLLIQQLRTKSEVQDIVNVVKWFSFTTFDIIGDLAFGEPFGMLKDGEWNKHISSIFGSIKVLTYIRAILEFLTTPFREVFLLLIVPRKLISDQLHQMSLAEERLKKRIEAGDKREDFGNFISISGEKFSADDSSLLNPQRRPRTRQG